MKNKLILIFIGCCMIFSSIYFINGTKNDFDKTIGGKHQIKAHKINYNNNDEAEISFQLTHSDKNKINPDIKVLNKGDLVYKGEKKIKDDSLGNYIIELTYTDTRLQKGVKKMIEADAEELKKNSTKSNKLVKNIKVAYPPDDSMMVVYIGCDKEPKINIEEIEEEMKITVSSK